MLSLSVIHPPTQREAPTLPQRTNGDPRQLALSLLEQLGAMSLEPCGHPHHHVWKHGGKPAPFCPEEHRQNNLMCAHARFPVIEKVFAHLTSLGMLSAADVMQLRSIVTGYSEMWQSDMAAVIMSQVAYANQQGKLSDHELAYYRREFRSRGIQAEPESFGSHEAEREMLRLHKEYSHRPRAFHMLLMRCLAEVVAQEQTAAKSAIRRLVSDFFEKS